VDGIPIPSWGASLVSHTVTHVLSLTTSYPKNTRLLVSFSLPAGRPAYLKFPLLSTLAHASLVVFQAMIRDWFVISILGSDTLDT
jgi:hypothetical protein